MSEVTEMGLTAQVGMERVVWTPEIAIAWLEHQRRGKAIAQRCHRERWLREHP